MDTQCLPVIFPGTFKIPHQFITITPVEISIGIPGINRDRLVEIPDSGFKVIGVNQVNIPQVVMRLFKFRCYDQQPIIGFDSFGNIFLLLVCHTKQVIGIFPVGLNGCGCLQIPGSQGFFLRHVKDPQFYIGIVILLILIGCHLEISYCQ